MPALLGVFDEEIGLAVLAIGGAVVSSLGGLVHVVLCCLRRRSR